MKKLTWVLLLVMFVLSIRNSYSQCSDAGVCIIGGRHKKTKADISASSLSFQYSLGLSGSPDNMVFHTFRFGGDFAVTNNFSVNVVLPVYSIVYKDQNILNKNGIGDAFVMGNFITPTGKNQNLSFLGGFKINTSSVDKQKFGFLNAQGSNDLLLGVDYNFSFLNFSGGTQIPLTNYKDDFGNQFKRGADFMFRTGIQRSAGDLKVKFELLGIKRLSESELVFTDGYTSKIKNSDFFQLNILGGLLFNLSPKFLMNFDVAIPMIKRDDNTDGTKRDFSSNIGIRYNI